MEVSVIAADENIPWEEVVIAEGSKGPIYAQVKYCRVYEIQDGRDGDEVWLYIRKYENGDIKYALSNAPADIEVSALHHAASLRWPIEQCFNECKSYLGPTEKVSQNTIRKKEQLYDIYCLLIV